MHRYLNEREHWNAHLEKTRAFIASAFRECTGDTVAILGSGWLLDVPLDDLRTRFDRILLVDIHHPPQIRRKFAHETQVHLLECDLSGGAILKAWNFAGEKGKGDLESFLGSMTLVDPLEGIEADALVSVNLLNQLDILLWDFLAGKRYFKGRSPDPFRSRIQSHHLSWITSRPGCLVTDTIEINADRNGGETSSALLFAELPTGVRRERWTWDFDSRGNYRSGKRTRMEVEAVEWA
jgi:hypothetical protein